MAQIPPQERSGEDIVTGPVFTATVEKTGCSCCCQVQQETSPPPPHGVQGHRTQTLRLGHLMSGAQVPHLNGRRKLHHFPKLIWPSQPRVHRVGNLPEAVGIPNRKCSTLSSPEYWVMIRYLLSVISDQLLTNLAKVRVYWNHLPGKISQQQCLMSFLQPRPVPPGLTSP